MKQMNADKSSMNVITESSMSIYTEPSIKNTTKTFIDTNVLIYAFTADEPNKRNIALEYIDECQSVISAQVLKEFSNVLLKKGNINHEEIKIIINGIIEVTSVIIDELAFVIGAFDIHKRYEYSFYDSLIITTALSAQCKALLSEDMQDGQIIDGSLRIINPFR